MKKLWKFITDIFKTKKKDETFEEWEERQW